MNVSYYFEPIKRDVSLRKNARKQYKYSQLLGQLTSIAMHPLEFPFLCHNTVPASIAQEHYVMHNELWIQISSTKQNRVSYICTNVNSAVTL